MSPKQYMTSGDYSAASAFGDDAAPLTPTQRERARAAAELIRSGANPIFALVRTLTPATPNCARA